MSNYMRFQFEGAFLGQTDDKNVQRFMYPWTGTQGPIINGKLIINHREDITLKSLGLTFKAQILCSWNERQGNSTVSFSGKKPLLEKHWVFLQESESKVHMLRANQTYSYDFSLALPVNLPNSLAMSTGKIEYMFAAVGKRSSCNLNIELNRVVEIYQSLPPTHPFCIYPLQQTNDFEGALNYLVQIPKKAYNHGSAIPIVVRMNPLQGTGARWHVKSMHVEIKEYFWFISPGKGAKEDKRTLVETIQGSGSWPVHAAPVERTISISLPTFNIMSTVDTEILKCSHKLNITFTIEVNGQSKKLATNFDLYVPGPFPPGQGPIGGASMVAQPMPPSMQQQIQQYPPPPGQMPTKQSYPALPFPTSMPTPTVPPNGFQQTPNSAFAQAAPFSPPAVPPHHQPVQHQASYPVPPTSVPPASIPGGGTPGSAASQAVPHPYSQGYPTPTTSHTYPIATSSQGYPTPALPPMPSPTVASNHGYPMPPSPALGYANSQPAGMPSPGVVHMSMPVPSPGLAAAQVSGPNATSGAYVSAPSTMYPKTPVISQQQQFTTSPKADSLKVMTSDGRLLQVDDSIKVDFNFDDTIKVSLDDIKVPSTPSTPSSASINHSKNPQQTSSIALSSSDGIGNITSNANVNQQESHQIIAVANKNQTFVVVPQQPQAPHAIKESSDPMEDFAYQPPPPPTSITSAKVASIPKQTNVTVMTIETNEQKVQEDLSQKFGQLGMNSTPRASSVILTAVQPAGTTAPVTMTTSPSMGFVKPPPVASPLTHPGASSAVNSASYANPLSPGPLSPVSAAATGAVVASQSYQQQSYHAPPPPPHYQVSQPVHVVHPSLQQQQVQQLQVQQPQPQPQPQPQQQQQQQKPQKQQVWIPMYQTVNGKLYVQYLLAA